MSGSVYSSCIRRVVRGQFRFGEEQIYLMLVTDQYVPAKEHSTIADVAHEVVGDGYVRGGLPAPSVVRDSEDTTEVVVDAVVWERATVTARGGVLYRRSDGALVAHVDFGKNKSSDEDRFTVRFTSPIRFKHS